MNQVQLLGRLTKDPEMSYGGQNNITICKFSIAISEKRNGQENSSFFDCKSFGKTAEAINQYIKKGQRILISGSLDQSRWQDKNTSQIRSKIEITVNRFDFIEKAIESNNQQNWQAPQHQDPFQGQPNFAPQENIPF